VPEHSLSANEEELAHAQRNSGITFAAHTWTHPNLASINGGELRDELGRPLNWLRERFVNVIPWISYPYGLSSPDVETAAAAAGYIAGLRIDGGWMKGFPTNPFAVPRFNVSSGISSRGFGLRASGLFAR
jgi:peptidoglycan/xylan/chitin deacetylase (PgdA/CDA1 family)